MTLPDLKAGIYKHYRGGYYNVEGYARHSETDEVFVLYTPLYVREGPRKCVRPVALFFDEVNISGSDFQSFTGSRFEYIGPEMPEGATDERG